MLDDIIVIADVCSYHYYYHVSIFFFQFPLVPVKQDKKYNVKAYDRVVFDREERCFGLYIALCAR